MKHFFVYPFQLLSKFRMILFKTSTNDIRARFAGSLLGVVWLFLYPLLMLGAYSAVYVYIFKVRFELFNSNEYVLLIFCGLIPFLGFSEALGTGTPSVVANSSLIKNTLFPIDLIPVKAVLISQVTQVIGFFYLLIALGITGKLTLWSLITPIIWSMQILFTIGLIWILSSLNVLFRDIQNFISILVLLLMMLSPIAYTSDMVPDNIRPFLGINPLSYFISAYQDSLMLGKMPDVSTLLTITLLGLFFFIIGYWFFSKMKKVFVDSV